jgi:predicted TIM-barrel fold metal-dependent hydrolase
MIIDFRVRPPIRDTADDPPVELPAVMERYVDEYGLDEKIQVTFEEMEAKASDAGIDVCVVQAEIEEPPSARLNDRVKEIIDRDPQRYVGFGGVDPTEPGAQAEAVRALDVLGLRGINIQPWASGMPPDHADCVWVFETCAERSVPITVHTGMNLAPTRSMELGHPGAVDRLAARFPDLPIVLNHGGWPWLDEAIAVAWRHPNVYIEFGAIAPRKLGEAGSPWEKVVNLMKDWFAPKVLFATDWPTLSFRRGVEEFSALDLPPTALRKAMGDNAAKLLGLDGDDPR